MNTILGHPFHPHRLKARFVLLLLLLISFSFCQAQASFDNWTQLKTQLFRNKPLLAQEITTHFELPGDDSKQTGDYATLIHERDGNRSAVRRTSTQSPEAELGQKMASLNLGMAEYFADRPEYLFDAENAADTQGTEEINGQTYSILLIRGLHPKFKVPIEAKIWVDSKTALPLRMQGLIKKVPLPGVNDASFTVTYQRDDAGRSLPAEVTVAYRISIFFHAGDVYFRHHLGKWQPRT